VRRLRPPILPDNSKLVVYPLGAGLAVVGTGVVIGNPVVIALPLIILAVFPGLPVLFHSIYHFFVEYQVFPDRLAVRDRVSDPCVRSRGRQEIRFGDIAYCFYVDKEAHLLMNLLAKLKPYNVPPTETDFRRENLLATYRVPEQVIDAFERSSEQTLNDVTATGVILEVEDVCGRNGVPRRTTREICKALERDEHLSFDTLKERLHPYPVNPADLERIRDKFASLDTPEMNPFLVTKINLKKLKKIESSRYGNAGMRSRVGLVLSNKDGTSKVYLMHFRDLSRKDSRELIAAIRDRTRGVKFLMTRNELKALLQ
jgi:hypothetical protein